MLECILIILKWELKQCLFLISLEKNKELQAVSAYYCVRKILGFLWLFQITLLRENVCCAANHSGKGILEPLTAQATVAEGHVAGAGKGAGCRVSFSIVTL